ncbi:hypothetical protein M0804_012287 [Polistes exclamans]|nr:hypothetical protein M0804_012287 [Polistes exclamans]
MGIKSEKEEEEEAAKGDSPARLGGFSAIAITESEWNSGLISSARRLFARRRPINRTTGFIASVQAIASRWSYCYDVITQSKPNPNSQANSWPGTLNEWVGGWVLVVVVEEERKRDEERVEGKRGNRGCWKPIVV